MKDAPAPAGARCMRAARAASRGRPASRLPAGARRGGACRGGRADAPPPSRGATAACGAADAEPSLLPCIVGSDGLYVARLRAAWSLVGARGGAACSTVYSLYSGAGGGVDQAPLLQRPLGSSLVGRPTTGRGCGADAVVNSAWPDAGLEVVSGADVIAALLLQRCRSEGLLVRAHSGTAAQSDECTELSEQYQPFVVVAEL